MLRTGIECGTQLGLIQSFYLSNGLLVPYLGFAIGPHWIFINPERQAKGLLISDKAFSGCRLRLNRDLYMDARFGFRHISNAGQKSPNGGVNTLNFSLGRVFSLPKELIFFF